MTNWSRGILLSILLMALSLALPAALRVYPQEVPFDYSLSVSPMSGGDVPQGGSTSTTVTATLDAGTSREVAVTASQPEGVTCSPTPSLVTPTQSYTLTCTVAADAALGPRTVTLTGSQDDVPDDTDETATYTFNVAPFDYSLSVSPTSGGGVFRGGSTTTVVTATLDAGTNARTSRSVSVTASVSVPMGISCSPASESVTPTRSYTLTCTVAANAPLGIVTVTLTGSQDDVPDDTDETATYTFNVASLVVTQLEDPNGDGKINPYEKLKFDASSAMATSEYCFNMNSTEDDVFEYCETPASAPDGSFDGMTVLSYADVGTFGGLGGYKAANALADGRFSPAVDVFVDTPDIICGQPLTAMPCVTRPALDTFEVAVAHITNLQPAGGVTIRVYVKTSTTLAGTCITDASGKCTVVSTLPGNVLSSCNVFLRWTLVKDAGFGGEASTGKLTVCPP